MFTIYNTTNNETLILFNPTAEQVRNEVLTEWQVWLGFDWRNALRERRNVYCFIGNCCVGVLKPIGKNAYVYKSMIYV